ncbi:PA2169 family four-helix-bundle protein [Solimonas terrae]|uniref:PA2169 family four-helix-bundle protein n=1 Tax=Solimonas terrae TaxID=1396819 RepID=A0A6M2BUQ4_9GAMM|nr:PA2169 family four-helix-bundle protein [Solimonas terrae]NGY05719.1 PA2169 family four-helix-bundle protein [Solimonas terrae]
MNTVDTIELLNKLIVTSKDGERGLRAAAEEAHHAELKAALFDYARFFGEAAGELQQAVRDLGGHPKEIGTFGHTLHRTWMHLKATALGRDEQVILDETERDEDEAEYRLATAVHEETPPAIHALLERQYAEAQRHHGQIREWREHAQVH